MLRYLRQILQLVLRPANGWEDVEADIDTPLGAPRDIFRHAFLPLVAACSVSVFVRLFYGMDFLGAFASCLVNFVAIFLSYYIACWAFGAWMPRIVDNESPEAMGRYQLLAMYTLSIVAIVGLVENLVKVRMALFAFLPLYSVFVLWKGSRFAGVPVDREGLYMLLASAAILGSYYGLTFIFNGLI